MRSLTSYNRLLFGGNQSYFDFESAEESVYEASEYLQSSEMALLGLSWWLLRIRFSPEQTDQKLQYDSRFKSFLSLNYS